MVAIITPVVHYCMGGVAGNEHAEVLDKAGKPISGLYVTGEALGGVHGVNRLGGSSLLDCVVYGRIAGATASKQLLNDLIATGGAGAGTVNAGNVAATVNMVPGSNKVQLELSFGGASAGASQQAGNAYNESAAQGAVGDVDPNAAFYGQGFGGDKKEGGAAEEKKMYTLEDVAKHNAEDDCWVILHGEVYDVTKFLPDHPGGKRAIMMYAGKDCTTEFDMLHSKDIIDKYAVEFHVGSLMAAKL